MKRLFCCLMAASILLLSGCASAQSEAQRWCMTMANTIDYDRVTGALAFSVPAPPKDYAIQLQVSGRLQAGDGSMSWHAFEEESASGEWAHDKVYTTQIDPAAMESLSILVSLERDGEFFGETHITYDRDDAIL